MSSMFRRPHALMAGLACCAVALAAIAGPAAAAKAKPKPAPKPVPKIQTVKGKVLTFEKTILTLTTGKKFKLDDRTKVTTRRGAMMPGAWSLAISPDDDVAVTFDAKRTISVAVAPVPPLPNGEYVTMGQTTYVYSDPKNPDAEGKDVPLLWLMSAKRARFVVELTEQTVLTGAGIDGEMTGGQAIKQALQNGSTVQIIMSPALPTVDKYGDPESPTRIAGAVKQIKVISGPANG